MNDMIQDGNTPLLLAVKHEEYDKILLLLRIGGDEIIHIPNKVSHLLYTYTHI